MAVEQLLIGIASLQATTGHAERTNPFFENSYNGTPFLNFINWAIGPAAESSLRSVNSKEKTDAEMEEIESTTRYYNSTTTNHPETHTPDSLSIMWYLASFGALVMFFLLISFSEVCCKKSFTVPPEDEVEVSPPPYDLFAPPTYDSLYEEKKEKNQKKKRRKKCEVFVIHVFGDKTSRVAPLEASRRNNASNS